MEKALEILENAVKAVDSALTAIDNFAEENGINLEASNTITLDELIHYVAEEEDICCHCTAKALMRAFSFLQANDLGLIMEEDDDDAEA